MLDLEERDDYDLQIVFVRHGESLGNIGIETPEGYHKQDTPLSDYGKEQAKLLSNGFEKGEITHIYSSPMTRTVQTIYPTAQKLGLQIELMPDLLEVGSTIEGCYPDRLKSEFPLAVPCTAEPTQSGGGLRLPENEPEHEITKRAIRCIEYFKRKYSSGETIIVTTHGAFFSHLLCAALSVKEDNLFRCQIDNCGCTVVTYRGKNRQAFLRTANNTNHLK